MKVLLVQAYLGGGEPPVFPLGLACLAGSLRGHDVKVFDTNIAENPYGDLADTVRDMQPDIVALSLRNIDSTNKRIVVFYYEFVHKTLDTIVSAADRKPRIVIGGSGFSMFAEKIMNSEPLIDYGVYLEGERILPDLIDNLDNPESVPGLYHRRNGETLRTGPASHLDLDDLPLPDRTAANVSAYRGIPEAIGVETKRGCPLHCVYCIYGFLNGTKMRLRSPSLIVDDIESMIADHGVEAFTFTDSVFNVPREHAEAVCREMINRKITAKWSAWFHDKFMTPEFAALAREAGCVKFIMSPDGFSDRTLELLGKGYTKQRVLETFDVLKNMEGGEICYNFFKNPPGQTLGTFLSLMWFFLRSKLSLRGRIHFEFSVLRVEPHTALHKIALDEGVVSSDDDLLYPKFYSNPATHYIQVIFDVMLRAKEKMALLRQGGSKPRASE